MFILTTLRDNVRISPIDFKKRKSDAIADELNKKYSNKVIYNVGLCIRLFDISHVAEPFVLPNDGSTYNRVTFRLVVFRPFIGEVLVGKIRSSSNHGVYVSLGFFDDILIPPGMFQEGSVFDKDEQIWYWKLEDNKLYMDIEEEIRFRVAKETFVDTMPALKESNPQSNTHRQSPYSITATINQDGLGLMSWWPSDENGE